MTKRPPHRPRNLRAWQDFYELCRRVEGPHGFTIALLRQVTNLDPHALSIKVRAGVGFGYFHTIEPGLYKLGLAPQQINAEAAGISAEDGAQV